MFFIVGVILGQKSGERLKDHWPFSGLSDLLHFAGKENNPKILDEIDIRPDSTKDCGVS